ncbi:MAG: Gfo/Idh/MocA family oxidoreductase [Candidatus Eisenbacteria bacterium]|nr:Gfo/Idh/MocA family oxidoreductase [Candidatus Eisenbacteria bacterium]
MSDVRFGLIGVGRHGARYASHLLGGDVPGGSLAAITRRDHRLGAEQAREWGVAYHEDALSLAADPAVDAVLVVSLSLFHPEGVEAAAGAGKPVLVEKPLARDLDGCDRIEAAVRRAGIPLMVAQTSRYEGVIAGLLEALPSIAPVREALFDLQTEDRTHVNGVFQERLNDDGVLLDSGVHYFDLIPRIIGPIREVWCERHFMRGTPIDDGYTALFRAAGGARAAIHTARWGGSRDERIRIAGEGGLLIASRTPHRLHRVAGRTCAPLPFPEVPGTLVPTLYDFLRVCRGESSPPIPLADGRAAVAVAEACRRSRGAWVALSG